VRRIRPEEWAAHRELRLRALSSDPLAFGSTLGREQDFADDLWRERATHGASSPDHAVFVADAGELGLVGMSVIASVKGDWHVFGMWVEPSYRQRGLGGKLLDAGLDWFRSVAVHQPLLLDVNPRQAGAVRLYESRGFRRTGVSAPLGHTEGETVIAMVLDPR